MNDFFIKRAGDNDGNSGPIRQCYIQGDGTIRTTAQGNAYFYRASQWYHSFIFPAEWNANFSLNAYPTLITDFRGRQFYLDDNSKGSKVE